ncbi:MAG: N-acetylglucosamine-6-phosphate deacetylase [Rhodobacteraceae bacterium]|nr:N-acetylglucosamine-6-phosphate deacetylase [Paracoccaceae bacterium]
MTHPVRIFRNGPIFDGHRLRIGAFAAFEEGRFTQFGAEENAPQTGIEIDLDGDILSVGYVDLQVNGGGGVMFNANPSVETLQRMSVTHRSLGVTKILPTLISDTAEKTRAAIAAAKEAIETSVPGIFGLHLEGPHLSITCKGAHDAALIRPMEAEDLAELLDAARELPFLKMTVAPESVSEDQVSQLTRAGVLVSLGHSDADFDTCQRYFAAGARCTTHLFNAMSQITNRAPGLAGAAIANGAVSTGLIADGIHVHPEVMRLAWQAKQGPGQIFLVSDAVAVAGTMLSRFELGGRSIQRKEGQLRLTDGTLAGADLDLTRAISVLVNQVGVDLDQALAAATSVPAALCGFPAPGLHAGVTRQNNMIRIRADLSGILPITQPALRR